MLDTKERKDKLPEANLLKVCPKCSIKLPLFAKDGKHNFCPSSKAFEGKIVEICMKCKMDEVVEDWKNP